MSASGVPFTDNIRDDAKEVVKSFIDGSGIKGADYKVSQNILTISVKDLGSVNVDLTGSTKAEVKIIKENLSKALKEVHEAVSQGKELSATEESDNADPLGLGI
jgi:RAB protein geranylgeranyltransferase component A